MKKLRVGIIGFGFIGPHHLDAIRRLGFADVTAVATSSLRGAREKAEDHFVEKAFGDWRALIADPGIDVVDVATPTHLHAPVALAAIANALVGTGKHPDGDPRAAIICKNGC